MSIIKNKSHENMKQIRQGEWYKVTYYYENKFHILLFLLFILDLHFFICLPKILNKSKSIIRKSQNSRNRVTENHGSEYSC